MSFSLTEPIFVYGFPQNYDWGKVGDRSAVAKLLASYDKTQPYAELWYGCHKNGVSLARQGQTKDELRNIINSDAEGILGKRVSEKFNKTLPFLFKVLSVEKALSIQTHPTKEQAKRLHAKNPNLYPDENHKPEIAIALTPLKLLYGFKTYEEIALAIRSIKAFSSLVDSEVVDIFLSAAAKDKEERFKNFYSELMKLSLTEEGRFKLKSATSNLLSELAERATLSEVEKLILQLADVYPDDVGLFAPLLMNLVTIMPGQAIFTEPGVLHTYIAGDILEAMANSDNVVRAGLTNKPCDVETLLEIVSYSPKLPPIINLAPSLIPNFSGFDVKAAEFHVEVLQDPNSVVTVNKEGAAEFLFPMNVKGTLTINNFAHILQSGVGILVPAGVDSYSATLEAGSLYRVTIP